MRSFLLDALANTSAWALGAADVPKAALFGNTPTPNQDDTIAHNAYNGAGGQWLSTSEVTDVTNWVAGGRPLVSGALQVATAATAWYDAADTAGGGNVTVSAYGVMVYDDTITTPVADPGMTYHAFGTQPSAVTAGTFTVVWDVNGIFRLAL